MQNPNAYDYKKNSKGLPIICTSIGAITAFWIVSHYLQQDEEEREYFEPLMTQLQTLMMPIIAECASNGTDKNLELVLNKIDNRMKDLQLKYPEMKRPMISSGF